MKNDTTDRTDTTAPLTVGLTGGIGAGKTTIAKLFEKLGYPIYIADTAANRLINNNPLIRTELIRHFGKKIYNDDGTLNKKTMADIIFNDKTALKTVNNIVHPQVIKDFTAWCKQQNGKIVFFEAAILFEAGLNTCFDYTICVYASTDTKIKRVIKRDNTTAEKVIERIKNQMDDKVKCRKSDFTINTDNGKMILQQLLPIIAQLQIGRANNSENKTQQR